MGANSAMIIVSNGSGNGRNGVATTLPGGNHIIIRNIGIIGERAGPARTGPGNKVVRGRTPVGMSGIVVLSPRAGGPAHVGGMRRGSNACIETTMGDNTILSGTGWTKERSGGYPSWVVYAERGSRGPFIGGSTAQVE